MRTNIVIDDDLMAEAMRVSGLKTKRETVEAALRLFIRRVHQHDMLSLYGKVEWDDDLDKDRVPVSRGAHGRKGETQR
ncbi:MAG: type II toxin-antitoxin system VapB family antitoxin [Geminicoccaceae bacterium]